MKEIIYLDTTTLHSYLAQTNGGLATNKSHEHSEQTNDSLESSQGYNGRNKAEVTVKSGEVEIPFIFKSPSGDIKLVLDPGKFSSEKSIMSQTEQGKEIISKQLHDNALEELEVILESKGLLSTTSTSKAGEFIKTSSTFKFLDFQYLNKILDMDKLKILFSMNKINNSYCFKKKKIN